MYKYCNPSDVIKAMSLGNSIDIGFELPNIMRAFDLILDSRFPINTERYLEKKGYFEISSEQYTKTLRFLPCHIFVGGQDLLVWSLDR